MDKLFLTEEEVKHIANLANLSLSEAEIKKFQEQLSETLSYIEDLNEIDTSKLNATSQVTGLVNVVSSDVPLPSLPIERALKNSKSKHNNLFKVKAVFG